MKRKEFPDRIKRQRLEMATDEKTGIVYCESCEGPIFGLDYQYDHLIPCALGGDNSLDNCRVVHGRSCHKDKTRTDDLPRITKSRRQRDKHFGIKRAKRPWPKRRMNQWS